MSQEVIIYKDKDGHIELNVSLSDETVWLTQAQLSDLFDKNKRTISEHINNILHENELNESSVVRNFRTTAADGKSYDTNHYNLDVIISVGYRVNSKQGTAFRQWATSVLKEHIIKGYTINEKRLAEQGLKELEQTVKLLHKTLVAHEHIDDIGSETIQLIISYAKTWYNEATQLFGNERDKGLMSILSNIEQIFDSTPLYPTAEERAAHLLYFIIKDHPFTDGNKRISCLIFLLYLKLQNIPIKLNQNGLMVKLTVNSLID